MTPLQIHPSASFEQKEAEKAALTWLSEKWGTELNPARIELGSAKVQIDGRSSNKEIVVEVYAGIGNLKPAQIKKVLADAFKLAALEKGGSLGQHCEKYLCFIDQTALDCFGEKHWYSQAFKALGIKLILAKIPLEKLESVRDAKNRQGLAFRNPQTGEDVPT